MRISRITAALLCLTTFTVLAQPETPTSQAGGLGRATHRNTLQQQRIDAGVRDGSLTVREAARLERGQARVGRQEFRAGRDGQVTAGEQRRIERQQDRQSRRIHRQRHDGQHAPG